MNSAVVKKIVDEYGIKAAPLLQVLLAVQDVNPQKYVSEEEINQIAQLMKISRSRVYSTASFYSEISLKPRGLHLIRVCINAPCENAGKEAILRTLEDELGISCGDTSTDGMFTLEGVNCLGACYMSPAIKVDDSLYGNLTESDVKAIIENLRRIHRNEHIA